jgi:branched-chain amino acid transport system ATP-binding protein
MLRIENLNVYYGGVHALKDVSIEVPRGSVVTLIGANGAGKSSTLRSICGLVKNLTGKIIYDGRISPRSSRSSGWSWGLPWCLRGGASSPI